MHDPGKGTRLGPGRGRVGEAPSARTWVTVSGLVAELIGEGLLGELGQQESQRPGKPAILVDLARDSHAVLSPRV